MKVTAHLPIVGAWLVLVGCQNPSTSIPEDAGQPTDTLSKTDTVAPAPDLASEDVSPPADVVASADVLAKDVAPLADVVASAEVLAEEVAPLADVAARADVVLEDAPPDLPAPEAPAKADMAPDKAPDSGVPDSAHDATSPSADLGSFCTGGASRMVVNGVSSTPSVTGHVLPLDCCEGGEFQISTATFDLPIVVAWQAQAGSFTGFKTIDLANPPSGWSVRVNVGCTSMSSDCLEPMDSYLTGLVGSLAISLGKRSMYEMSLCLHVEESADSLHPLLHTLDLFATHIEAD
jgi:hypothetical protein